MINRTGKIRCSAWESSSSARCAWNALNRDLAPHTKMVINDTEWLAAFSTATRVPRTFGLLKTRGSRDKSWAASQKVLRPDENYYSCSATLHNYELPIVGFTPNTRSCVNHSAIGNTTPINFAEIAWYIKNFAGKRILQDATFQWLLHESLSFECMKNWFR